MKPPEEEQRAIDAAIMAQVLVLDAVGAGSDTPYVRQVLQEILDAREYRERGGLVVTSRSSPTTLDRTQGDDSTGPRLAGMCRVVEMRGPDRRLRGPGGLRG